MLGNWFFNRVDVAEEIRAAEAIESRLREDLVVRILISSMITLLIIWIERPVLALIWFCAFAINEKLELSVFRLLRNQRYSERFRLSAYLTHMTLGAGMWASLGLSLWIGGDAATKFLALTTLIGVLVHASVLYGESRIQMSATMLFPLIAIIAATLASVLSPDFQFREKTLIVFSFGGLLMYVLNAASENLRGNQIRFELFQETQRIASDDPLTGLMNRRAFVEEVEQRVLTGTPYTLAFIDLDRFKPVNDEYGHKAGDLILQEVAHRLEVHQGVERVARIGGDEFALLLDGAHSQLFLNEQFSDLCQKIGAPIMLNQSQISVGLSIGFARSRDAAKGVSSVLHAADTAMLRAKSTGGGCVGFDCKLDACADESDALERALVRDIHSGALQPALQPLADAKYREVIGYEVLARWDPQGIARAPSTPELIAMAERAGLLNKLLFSLLEQAAPVVSGTGLSLALNVSPSQLGSNRFLNRLVNEVKRCSLTPDQIEIEITEEMAIRNLDDCVAILTNARALGFKIVLDDFGTGYSSLSMVDRLPLDKIKIDRSFVRSGSDRPRESQIIRCIVQIARELNLDCCVEGVETREIEESMAALGCDQLQGYYIGRPQLISTFSPVTISKAPAKVAM